MVIAGGDKEPIEMGLHAQPYGDGDVGGGSDRSLPSIDRIDIVNDIDAGYELLGDESSRDARGFLW